MGSRNKVPNLVALKSIELFVHSKQPIWVAFFLTNNTGDLQGDTLGRMNILSNKSCNWIFSSFISAGAIWYGALEIGLVLGNKSITNFTSPFRGKPGKSSGNTSEYSLTTGMSSIFTSNLYVFITEARNSWHACLINFVAFKAYIIGIVWSLLIPSNMNFGTFFILKMILLSQQSTCAQQTDNQSIFKITSNFISSNLIKSVSVLILPIITS